MEFYADPQFHPGRSIHYLIRRVHQSSDAILGQVFAAERLTSTQWLALMSILIRRGATAAELARDLRYDKGATTRLIDVVERRGWVVRTRASRDRRCINLDLTDEGVAVATRCKRRVIKRWDELLRNWDESESRMIIVLLAKLCGTLEASA